MLFLRSCYKRPACKTIYIAQVLLWVLDHLSLRPTDSVFLAVPVAIMRQFDLERIVRRLLPHVDFKILGGALGHGLISYNHKPLSPKPLANPLWFDLGACSETVLGTLKLQPRIVVLPFETRGWLETVLSVTRQMSAKESRNCLVTLDCSLVCEYLFSFLLAFGSRVFVFEHPTSRRFCRSGPHPQLVQTS